MVKSPTLCYILLCMIKISLVLYLLVFSCSAVLATSLLKYKVQKGDIVSNVLDDLGSCPLYGKDGHVDKIQKINPNINFKKLYKGQDINIPYEYLKRVDQIIFLKDNYIVPKNRNSNLCERFVRKKN